MAKIHQFPSKLCRITSLLCIELETGIGYAKLSLSSKVFVDWALIRDGLQLPKVQSKLGLNTGMGLNSDRGLNSDKYGS